MRIWEGGSRLNKKEKTKKGYYFWLSEKAEKQIDSHLPLTAAKSRSEFVCNAIEFYCCEMDSDKHRNVITSEMSRVVRDNIGSLESHLSHIMFKLAVEQATINLLLADRLFDMTDKEILAYRNNAYDIVRKNNGFVSFENAVEDARELSESDDN